MPQKKILLGFALTFLIALSLFAGCGADSTPEEVEKILPVVATQTLAESKILRSHVRYPGLLVAENSTTLTARVASTVAEVAVNFGERVTAGTVLLRLADISGGVADAVKQAELAVEQAQASRDLAQKSYDNLVASAVKDLRAAEITKNQAQAGQTNLNLTTTENIRLAEQALATARVAVEQARLALENRKILATQATADAEVNARTTSDSVMATCGTIIDGANNLLALAEKNPVSIPYKTNLGALDSSTYTRAQNDYESVVRVYDSLSDETFSMIAERVAAILTLVEETKQLVDVSTRLLEKTVSSNMLPATSSTSTSLASLKSAIAGYQTQASSALTQINSARQSLTNTALNNQTQIENLQKAYELAQAQAKSAEANLANIRAGNTSALSSAGFGVSSAENQFSTLKIKLDSSVAAARSQLELAELNLKNARVALDSVTKNHVITAPIDGTVTQKFVSVGSAVTLGTPLVTLSQSTNLKIQFYVDETYLAELKPGFALAVSNNDAQNFSAVVTAASPAAESTTKRFLIEAVVNGDAKNLPPAGSVVDVAFDSTQMPQSTDTIFLPLSSITIGQNENSVFVVKAGKVQKLNIQIVRVMGESAEVSGAFAPEMEFVVVGNKFLQEWDEVRISNDQSLISK